MFCFSSSTLLFPISYFYLSFPTSVSLISQNLVSELLHFLVISHIIFYLSRFFFSILYFCFSSQVFLHIISPISISYLPHPVISSPLFFLISHIFISYFLLISRISASQLIHFYILSSKFLSQTSHVSVSYLPHFYISSPRFPFLNSHISLPLLPHRYLISISHLSFAYLLRLPCDSLSSPVPISSLPPLLILLPLLLLPLPPFYSKFF